MARNRLVQAGGFDVASGQSTVSDYRVTSICFFQKFENPLITDIQQRVAKLTKTNTDWFEGIQYGLYNKGGYYKGHYDFADKSWAGGVGNFLNRGGQRWLTLLAYLNTLQEGDGGETTFPNNDPPLVFRPKQGMALVFYNTFTDIIEDGTPIPLEQCDYSTYHTAEPVIRDGVQKHIITQWVRESVFV
jgi:prolyl 4-hydroxylase